MRSASRCRERVAYSLQQKGARVVTGRNLDDDGSQSNASGKSSLVMAPLWALTGRSDARAEVSCVSQCGAMQPCNRHSFQLISAQDALCSGQTQCLYMAAKGLLPDMNPLEYSDLTSPGHDRQRTKTSGYG